MSGGLPEPLLNLLKLALVALIYLFFVRVLRAIWAQLKEPKPGFQPPPQQKRSEDDSDKPKRGTASSLRVVEPANKRGTNFQITSELTIGRASGCHISLDDSYTSQLHARVFRQDGQVYVEDLGSTNGTFLNRRKVTAPSPLHAGDRLQIGRTVFEVRK